MNNERPFIIHHSGFIIFDPSPFLVIIVGFGRKTKDRIGSGAIPSHFLDA